MWEIISGILSSVIIARGLGVEDLGKYALIISLTGLVSNFSQQGIGQTAVRFGTNTYAKKDIEGLNAIFRWAIRIIFIITLTVSLIFYFFIPIIMKNFWKIDYLTELARLSIFYGIFSSIAVIPELYYQAQKKFFVSGLFRLGKNFLYILGIIIVAVLQIFSLKFIIISNILSSVLFVIISIFLVPRSSLFEFSEFIQLAKNGFRKVLLLPDKYAEAGILFNDKINDFALSRIFEGILNSIITKIDIWLLGALLSPYYIGIYNVAQKVLLPIGLVYNATFMVINSRFSSLNSIQQSIKLFWRTHNILFIVLIPLFAYSLIVPQLIPFLFGIKFKESVLIGIALCFFHCLLILSHPSNALSFNLGFSKYSPLRTCLRLVIFTGSVIILIPLFKIWGVVISYYLMFLVNISIVNGYIYYKYREFRDNYNIEAGSL